MKEITEELMKVMQQASGLTPDQITSRSRRRPLPYVRYMIARELLLHGYPSIIVAGEMNIDHATVLHGRKMLDTMRCSPHNWVLEIEIEERFLALLGKPIKQ